MFGNVLGFLMRVALLAAGAGTGVAILVARAHPEPASRRTETPAPFQVLNAYLGGGAGAGPRLLAVGSGRLEALTLPPGMALDDASLSPWEDRGQRQVVGLAWDRAGVGETTVHSNVGMVRMTLPGCEILGKVDLSGDSTPMGPPCWFPGTRARVLYAGRDGRVYLLDFETPRADAGPPEIRPRALTWGPGIAGEGAAVVSDLSWPDDPRLGGKLVATLVLKDRKTGRPLDPQIWWLELDRGGTSVADAGPLLERPSAQDAGHPRLPNVVRGPGGASTLAYLVKTPGEATFRLRAVPVHLEPGSNAPRAREDETRDLARGLLLAAPAASPDGRWVNVVRPRGPAFEPDRLELGGPPTLVTRLP